MIQEKYLEEVPREVEIYRRSQKGYFREIFIPNFIFITLAVFFISCINALIEVVTIKIPL